MGDEIPTPNPTSPRPSAVQVVAIIGGVLLYVVSLLLQYLAHAPADAMEVPKGIAVTLLAGSPAVQTLAALSRGERGSAPVAVMGIALAFCAVLGVVWSLAGSGCASLTGRSYQRLDWATLPGSKGPASCVVVFTGDGQEVARLSGDVCPPPTRTAPP